MQTTRTVFYRDFILVFIAQIAFNSVERLLMPTLPIYLKKMGSAEVEIGIFIGAFGLASLFSRPFTGKMLTNMSERTLMLIGSLFYIASSLAYIMIPPFWPLLFVRILQGAGFGFFHTASTTYVVNITEVSKRARVLAYFAVAMNIASAIAPPLGIVVADRFGFNWLFLVCIVVSVCMLCISSTLGKSHRESLSDPPKQSGFHMLSMEALPASMLGFVALFIVTSVATFYPLYAKSVGVSNPGLFFTVMAIMLVLCRTLGGRILDIPNRKIVVYPCIIICIISMAILSFSKTQPMFLLAAALLGLSQGFLMSTLMAFALEQSDSSTAPNVATFYVLSDTGVFLGPLAMGVISQYKGYPGVFFGLSVVSFMSLLYFLYISKKIHQKRSE